MDRICLGIGGISGQGKSFLTKKKVIPFMAQFKPIIIFDRLDEYSGGKKDVDYSGVKYDSFQSFYDRVKETQRIEKTIHVIRCQKDEDYIQGLKFFRLLEKPVSIFLDEAHDIFISSEFKAAKEAAVQIARYGRHAGIDLIMISQRTYDIHPDVRSQFLGYVSFKQTHESDVKALENRGWENAKKILDLNKKEFEIFGEVPNELKKAIN